MRVYTWNHTHINIFHTTSISSSLTLVLYFMTQTHCIPLYKPRAFHSSKCGLLCSESTKEPGSFLQADWQGIVVQLVYQSLVVLFLFETGRIIASGVTKTNVIQFLPPNSWNGHVTCFLGLFTQKKKVVVKNLLFNLVRLDLSIPATSAQWNFSGFSMTFPAVCNYWRIKKKKKTFLHSKWFTDRFTEKNEFKPIQKNDSPHHHSLWVLLNPKAISYRRNIFKRGKKGYSL